MQMGNAHCYCHSGNCPVEPESCTALVYWLWFCTLLRPATPCKVVQPTPTRLRRSSHRSPDDIERPSSERFCHMLTQSPGQSPGVVRWVNLIRLRISPGLSYPSRTRWAAFTRVKKRESPTPFRNASPAQP